MTRAKIGREADEPLGLVGLIIGLTIALTVVDGVVRFLLYLNVSRMAGVRDATLSLSFAIGVVGVLLFGSSKANRALARSGRTGLAVGAFALSVLASMSVVSWGATFTTNEALTKTSLDAEFATHAPFTRKGFELVSWQLLDAVPVLSIPAVFDWEEPTRPNDPPFVFGVSLALARLTAVVAVAGFAKGLWELLHRETDINDDHTQPPA
jgi:hypothetical protein